MGSALLLGASGCAVYVPMPAAAPDIKAKGEVEATGSWAFTNRVDFGGTYSPACHLLVRAAASLKWGGYAGSDSASYAQNNQYELAAGTYQPVRAISTMGPLFYPFERPFGTSSMRFITYTLARCMPPTSPTRSPALGLHTGWYSCASPM